MRVFFFVEIVFQLILVEAIETGFGSDPQHSLVVAQDTVYAGLRQAVLYSDLFKIIIRIATPTITDVSAYREQTK